VSDRGRKTWLCKGRSPPLDKMVTVYLPQLRQNENCCTPSPPVDKPCHVVYNRTYVLYKEAPRMTHNQIAVRRRNVHTHGAFSQAIFPPPSRALARPTIRPIVVFTKRTHFGIGLPPPGFLT